MRLRSVKIKSKANACSCNLKLLIIKFPLNFEFSTDDGAENFLLEVELGFFAQASQLDVSLAGAGVCTTLTKPNSITSTAFLFAFS